MIAQLVLMTLITLSASDKTIELNEPLKTYGEVEVQKVVKLDPSVQICCDLKDMPPIIGSNIPVCINGLRPASTPKDNLKLMMFLNDLLLSKKNKPQTILLKDIRRGEHFCLIADIYIDGRNLCDLIVEQNLATKVIEVVQPNLTEINQVSSPKEPSQHSSPATSEYIASRSSKVFHWAKCSHAKRMDTAKAIYFVNPEDAAKTGRRPCKTCKPQ